MVVFSEMVSSLMMGCLRDEAGLREPLNLSGVTKSPWTNGLGKQDPRLICFIDTLELSFTSADKAVSTAEEEVYVRQLNRASSFLPHVLKIPLCLTLHHDAKARQNSHGIVQSVYH